MNHPDVIKFPLCKKCEKKILTLTIIPDCTYKCTEDERKPIPETKERAISAKCTCGKQFMSIIHGYFCKCDEESEPPRESKKEPPKESPQATPQETYNKLVIKLLKCLVISFIFNYIIFYVYLFFNHRIYYELYDEINWKEVMFINPTIGGFGLLALSEIQSNCIDDDKED